MANAFKKVLRLLVADDPLASLRKVSRKERKPKVLTERQLISLESEIGRTIFGPMPENVVRREFFNLDEKTWIWHEEVAGSEGLVEEMTTRYEVQDRGILKIQPGPKYSYLTDQELYNFVLATKEYYERTARHLYLRDPQTGQPL